MCDGRSQRSGKLEVGSESLDVGIVRDQKQSPVMFFQGPGHPKRFGTWKLFEGGEENKVVLGGFSGSTWVTLP